MPRGSGECPTLVIIKFGGHSGASGGANSGGRMADLDLGNASPRPLRRRAVTTGLAWAVPAVLVGPAAPAFAASGCPSLSYSLDDSHASYDQILIRNTGATPLAAGTTISWVVQNRSAANASLSIIGTSGVSVSPTTSSLVAGGQATLTITLTAPLAAGATLSWSYAITGWNYATRVTVTGCVGATACLSSVLFTPGTACPAAARAGAPAAAGGSTTFPDPRNIAPKR